MQTLTRDDLQLDLSAYAEQRAESRARAIALKKIRRVQLGDIVTFVFENRETLRHQVQEMLFAEHTTDPAKIEAELAVYNPLLPTDHELSATLFLEMPDMATLKAELPRMVGIEESVTLRIGEETAKAIAEAGRSRDDYTATVHYVRFPLTDSQRDAFRDPAVPAELSVDHPAYAESAPITGETRLALLADLALD